MSSTESWALVIVGMVVVIAIIAIVAVVAVAILFAILLLLCRRDNRVVIDIII